MFESITKPITDFFQSASDFFAYFTISPFWLEWLPIGLGIIALAFVVAWFFPAIRGFAGAVVLSVIAFLVAFRKGEESAEQRYKKQIDKLKQQANQRPTNNSGWRW